MIAHRGAFGYFIQLTFLACLCWISSGCSAGLAQSWHEKNRWKAEDFFEDAKVIALCKAIEANDLKEMEKLIKDGADVKAKGKGNMTPLLWAFPDNRPERFKLLLEKGADPNVVTESDFGIPGGMMPPGMCITEMTAKSRFPILFEEVMKHGGDPNFVNAKSKRSILVTVLTTPTDYTRGRVQLLIDKGADLNNMSTRTPPVIAAATSFGQFDIALILLKAGADPKLYIDDGNMKLTHILLGAKENLYKFSPPESQRAYEELVEWLKSHGESFDEAQSDLDRWQKRAHLSSAEKGKLRRAEIAERKAREAAEKAKKDAAANQKKP